MISTSQKEHLTYTLILQVSILAGLAILAWSYIFPGITKIWVNQAAAQAVIDEYNETKENGLSFDTLGKKLTTMKGKEELIKIVRSAPTETRTVIKKNVKWEYAQWLNAEISNSNEDKKKLTQAKQKINSILPTMSPISNSLDEDFITLKEYIKFIESEFLVAFDIKSNIVLWLQWITYNPKAEAANVGTFDLRLDFKASNSNIQKLITYVNDSGNPAILAYSWVLTEDKVPKILSNPLMTIETLALENSLDGKRPDAINNGRATIRFYVRGSSKEDITFLKWAINSRKENLQKGIEIAKSECKKQGQLCTEMPRFETFEKKYTEFVRSLGQTKWGESDDITILGQTATSLRGLDDEFKSITQNNNTRK
jgi:hypothetical protein